VYYCDIKEQKEVALGITKKGFEAALENITKIDEKTYKETSLLM